MSVGAELYPYLSWDVTIAALTTMTVSVTGTLGTSTTTVTITAGTYKALLGSATWGTASVYVTSWLHLQVSEAIASATGIIEVDGAVAATGYAYPRISHTAQAAVGVVGTLLTAYIEGPTALMRRLGFHGTPSGGIIRISATTAGQFATFSTTGFSEGLWAPMVPWSDVEDIPGHIAQQAASPFEPSQRTVVELGDRHRRVVQWRHVPMRSITAFYATDPVAASVALTSTSDTYGTVERVVDAAIAGEDFAFVPSAGTSQTVILDWSADLSVADLAERESAFGGRRYSVTLPLVDT